MHYLYIFIYSFRQIYKVPDPPLRDFLLARAPAVLAQLVMQLRGQCAECRWLVWEWQWSGDSEVNTAG
jgi:hypothetical protein